MSRIALLIRTHFVDEALLAEAGRIEADGVFDVYALADESRAALDLGPIPKLSLTPAVIAELGVYAGAPNLLWRCGDYGLYAARRALPQYDGFWMIEPDVRVNAERPSDVLAGFPGPEQVDFVAGRLRPAEADWDWAATMDPAAGPVWRCLFAVTRVSARAIDLLHEARRQASAVHVAEGRDPALWPNDEAFVATTIARSGLPARDLNDFGRVYEEAGLSFWFPLSHRELAASGRDGLIYHPVLTGEAYFLKLCRLAVRHGALDALEAIVERMTGLEWTAEQAQAHRRVVDFLRTQQAVGSAGAPLAVE